MDDDPWVRSDGCILWLHFCVTRRQMTLVSRSWVCVVDQTSLLPEGATDDCHLKLKCDVSSDVTLCSSTQTNSHNMNFCCFFHIQRPKVTCYTILCIELDTLTVIPFVSSWSRPWGIVDNSICKQLARGLVIFVTMLSGTDHSLWEAGRNRLYTSLPGNEFQKLKVSCHAKFREVICLLTEMVSETIQRSTKVKYAQNSAIKQELSIFQTTAWVIGRSYSRWR
jgi:hypothetical protein